VTCGIVHGMGEHGTQAKSEHDSAYHRTRHSAALTGLCAPALRRFKIDRRLDASVYVWIVVTW
jgi:hypothetical protein